MVLKTINEFNKKKNEREIMGSNDIDSRNDFISGNFFLRNKLGNISDPSDYMRSDTQEN